VEICRIGNERALRLVLLRLFIFFMDDFVALDDYLSKKTTIATQGEFPIKGATVSVHYTGKLLDDTVFDSSIGRSEFKFKLGHGQVIKGWDIGLASMRLGEHATLRIHPDYGYGKAGSPPKIPGDSVLIFDVQLLGIDLSTADLTDEQRSERALLAKANGNDAYKAQDFAKARDCYLEAIGFSKDSKMSLDLHSNLAQAYLKLQDGQECVNACQKALEIDPRHPKALYRQSQGLVLLKEFKKAISILDQNKVFYLMKDLFQDSQREILAIATLEQQHLKKEKKLYSKMFL
jgi:peptidylprolyl isomerase